MICISFIVRLKMRFLGGKSLFRKGNRGDELVGADAGDARETVYSKPASRLL